MKQSWLWLVLGILVLAIITTIALRAEDSARVQGPGPPWTDDYKAAIARAKYENKLLLLDFTGGDWCEGCIRLHDDVFMSRAFDRWSKKFVLVEVDFPIDKKLPDGVMKQNDALQKKYNVDAFPTIIILDANEKTVTTSEGYAGEGPKDWITARDGEIAKAQPR